MAGRQRPGNLPAELNSFVGRRDELSDVRRLVAESRLVTLTGTAGVGKTRLAMRVAGLHGRTFGDGVWVVELDHVMDRSLVAEAVAESLGVPEHAGRESQKALETFVAGREMLLVVDNCEHVAETVTTLLGALLRRASRLHVLATSREVLGVPGEVTRPVEPLPLPNENDAATHIEVSPAVALFAERAAAAVHGLELTIDDLPIVVEICRQLDGMPLALELAAAQLRLMSAKELAGRLDDRFRLLTSRPGSAQPRHQTLRAAVEWSYELCDKLERLLWQRLSVFAGDFDLRDVEAVCADDALTQDDVTEVMRGLVDKSILSVRAESGSVRFRLLDTLRRYGLDRLSEDERDGVPPQAASRPSASGTWPGTPSCRLSSKTSGSGRDNTSGWCACGRSSPTSGRRSASPAPTPSTSTGAYARPEHCAGSGPPRRLSETGTAGSSGCSRSAGSRLASDRGPSRRSLCS